MEIIIQIIIFYSNLSVHLLFSCYLSFYTLGKLSLKVFKINYDYLSFVVEKQPFHIYILVQYSFQYKIHLTFSNKSRIPPIFLTIHILGQAPSVHFHNYQYPFMQNFEQIKNYLCFTNIFLIVFDTFPF